MTNREEKIHLEFSEDCLYLNIYTPADLTKSSRLPVSTETTGLVLCANIIQVFSVTGKGLRPLDAQVDTPGLGQASFTTENVNVSSKDPDFGGIAIHLECAAEGFHVLLHKYKFFKMITLSC